MGDSSNTPIAKKPTPKIINVIYPKTRFSGKSNLITTPLKTNSEVYGVRKPSPTIQTKAIHTLPK